jgi:hypothetical protein
VHVTTPYLVAKPLTLVSTWDGDELSLIQAHHQLRAARRIDVAAASEALDAALAATDHPSRGLGLYRVIDGGAEADRLADALADAGVRVRRFPNGRLGLAPALDTAVEDAAALRDALRALP